MEVDKRTSGQKAHFAKSVFRFLLAVLVVIISGHLFLQYLNLVVFAELNGPIFELSNRFDLDDEIAVPTWLAQGLFLAIGAGALFAAYLQTDKIVRRLWLLIASLGVLVSLDEVSSLHEFVLQRLHVMFFQDAASTSSANAWWVILPFVLLIIGWLGWQMIRHFPRRTMTLFIVGGALFMIGAVVFDAINSSVPKASYLNQGLLVAIEEGLELLGGIIFFYAIADYLERYHYRVISQAIAQLKLDKNKPSKHKL